jgi:hypothetical protein
MAGKEVNVELETVTNDQYHAFWESFLYFNHQGA